MKAVKQAGISALELKNKVMSVINILSWAAVIFSIFVLVSVFLSTHNIMYIKFLNNYNALQVSMSVTMLLWAGKFCIYENTYKTKFTYSAICLALSVGSIFFMMMNVY